jgi:hypothetical protein
MERSLKKAMIVVTADPRDSGRVAEAVRIAAGVGAWEKVTVNLCLANESILALGETVDDLVNGDVFENYLPLLLDGDSRLSILAGSAMSAAARDSRYAAVPVIDPSTLGRFCREADVVLRF